MAVSICGWTQLVNGPGIGKRVNCFDRAFLNPNIGNCPIMPILDWPHPQYQYLGIGILPVELQTVGPLVKDSQIKRPLCKLGQLLS